MILHVAIGTSRSEQIAKLTGIGQRTVQLVLERLQALRLVELHQRWTARGRQSRWTPLNQYVWQSRLVPDAVGLLLNRFDV